MHMREVIDHPESNDNRKYDYTSQGKYWRGEFPIIAQWIDPQSTVLDLGCGNGSLMQYLIDQKQVEPIGVEISPSGVEIAQAQGLRVSLGSIDDSTVYASFADKQFDYVVCNVTLPMVSFPEVVLAQMQRVARFQIISFPNFAYLGNRLDLLVHGRYPQKMLFGYTWYSTGLIHQLSIADFKKYCREHNMQIIRSAHLGATRHLASVCFPNLFSKEGIFLCQTNQG